MTKPTTIDSIANFGRGATRLGLGILRLIVSLVLLAMFGACAIALLSGDSEAVIQLGSTPSPVHRSMIPEPPQIWAGGAALGTLSLVWLFRRRRR